MHFFSLNRAIVLPSSEYLEYEGTAGYAFQDQVRGTVPFYWWYSSRFNDLRISQNREWSVADNLGYVNGGIIFFANTTPNANMRRLRHFVSNKDLENFYTPWNAESDALLASGDWFEQFHECYVPHDQVADARVLHRWRSKSGSWCAKLIRHDGTVAQNFEVNRDSQYRAEMAARSRFDEYNREAKPEDRAYEMRCVPGNCAEEISVGSVKLRRSSKAL